MITVLVVTSRGPYSWLDTPLGTYDLLARSLTEQTLPRGDFEVVVVDKFNQLPRRELTSIAGLRARFLRPRPTPWTERGFFAAAAARNTGLIHARGDVVLALDDGWELGPRTLERVAQHAAAGRFVVPQLRDRDGGVQRFRAPGMSDDLPGGILAFPLAAAVGINGVCERYDGCAGYEDVDFARRLSAVGVEWARDDPDAHVVGHRHAPRGAQPRCGLLVWLLNEARRARGGARALLGCEPWSADELAALEGCGRELEPPRCARTVKHDPRVGEWGGQCDYDEDLVFDPDQESERARRMRVGFRHPSELVKLIQRTYEARPWLDLAAERARARAAEPVRTS